MELLQSLLSNLWALFLVVFFFEASIFVHELGHYLAARRRGVMVERFSLGMGPPLFRWRGKNGVEYWLSWFPIGGYVKLPQLADLRDIEGDSTADLSQLPAISYSTKVLVFIAGAVFNVLFAFFLATVLWVVGFPVPQDVNTTKIGHVIKMLALPDGTKQQSPASKADLHPGDEILAIDGREVHDWTSVQQRLALGSGRTLDGKDRLVHLRFKRGSEIIERDLNPILTDSEKIRRIGISQAHEMVIGRVVASSYAEQVGLQPGDRIVSVDTVPLLSLAQLDEYLETHAAAKVTLQVQRGAATVSLDLPTSPAQKTSSEVLPGAIYKIDIPLVHQNPFEQLQRILANTIESFAVLINPHSDIGLSKMSGTIGIFTQFWQAATSDYPVRVTMWLTILINISLAVFNLLPIPVLDGGHILFATIGKLRGRALPPDFVNAAQSVFIVLLFSLLIYVSYYDVLRMLRSDKADPASPPPPAEAPPAALPAPAKP